MSAERAAGEGAPLYFGPKHRTLFGWFHEGARDTARACGVVLVSPIGVDHTRSHRSYRHLAMRLARAGFPTLRFDLHGTGDSADGARDSDARADWLADIDAAIAELKRQSGAVEIALAGLRLGGTLAMTAGAARGDVATVVLWGPCASGEAYVKDAVRMHKTYAMLEPQRFKEGPPRTGGKEALGFFMSDALLAELGKLDLLAVDKRPAERALVINTENAPLKNGLLERLRALGTATSDRHMPGQKFLIQTPRQAALPDEILDAIVAYLHEQHPPAARAAVEHAPRPSTMTLEPSRVTEEWLRFGHAHALFGILTRPPPGAARSGLPAIVFTNAGCINRSGAQRNHTTLARRWAALGFNVLRFDLSGIGDSQAQAGVAENEVFPPAAPLDIRDAFDRVRELCKVDRFIIVGLCSGGDYAFKTGFDEPRVVGAVLMNPRTFLVNANEIVEAYSSARYYQGSMMQKDKWLKLLKGQVDVRRVAAQVIPKVTDVVKKRLGRLTGALRSEPKADDVPGCLKRMAERGVNTLLVVSDHDPGIEYVDAHYRDEMRALESVRNFRRENVSGADHSFTSLWSQEHVHDFVTEHLTRHFLA